MADSSRRRNGALIALVFVALLTAFLLNDLVFGAFGPLTPERARDVLAEKYPELADAPITTSDGGGIRVGSCWCSPQNANPPPGSRGTPTWHYLPPFPPDQGFQRYAGGKFERSWTGRWKLVEGGVFLPLATAVK